MLLPLPSRALRLLNLSDYARTFIPWIRAHRFPAPVAEHRFHTKRRWRFDFAWPDSLIALEIEGGVWSHGRHVRGKGYKSDLEKYSTAAVMGWAVIRVVPEDLYTERTLSFLRQAFALKH